MVIFTQPDNLVVIDTIDPACFLAETHKNRTMSPRHRLKKPIHNVKEACISRPYMPDVSGKPLLFISGNLLWHPHLRSGVLRENVPRTFPLSAKLVEPIGIEPMT